MMKEKDMMKITIVLAIISLVLIDQITKLVFEGKRLFLDSFVYIFSTDNTGSAFGMFASFTWYPLAVIILSFVILLVLIINRSYFMQTNAKIILFVFFISGILGNLIDRIFLGHVRDFIAIEYFSIFNVADIFLTLAVLLYLWVEFSEDKDLKRKNVKRS